jgi:hypothetical protein
MSEFKTISDSEFNNYKNLLEEYKTEREIVKQNYHDRSKILTSKIHDIEHIITKEDGIRNKRGKYWIDYKKEQIFKLYKSGELIENIANKFQTTKQSIINAIEDKYWYEKRIELRKHLLKTDGIVNDSLPLDTLFYRHIFQSHIYKDKKILTVGDFYKNINSLNKREIKKVENEISDVEFWYQYWKEKQNKEWRYHG